MQRERQPLRAVALHLQAFRAVLLSPDGTLRTRRIVGSSRTVLNTGLGDSGRWYLREPTGTAGDNTGILEAG